MLHIPTRQNYFIYKSLPFSTQLVRKDFNFHDVTNHLISILITNVMPNVVTLYKYQIENILHSIGTGKCIL